MEEAAVPHKSSGGKSEILKAKVEQRLKEIIGHIKHFWIILETYLYTLSTSKIQV